MTYSISRDGLADLALPAHLDALLADIDGQVETDIETAINAKIQEHGVTEDGEWLGDWSAEGVVLLVLARHHMASLATVTRLGAEHAASRARAELARLALREAVVAAAREAEEGGHQVNESKLSRLARVDRMTILSWLGKR